MTVIQFAHIALFLVQFGFFLFQFASFARGEFAALDAIGDAILLVFFPLINRGRLGCRGAVSGLSRRRQNEPRHCSGQDEAFVSHIHIVLP